MHTPLITEDPARARTASVRVDYFFQAHHRRLRSTYGLERVTRHEGRIERALYERRRSSSFGVTGI